MANMDPGGPPAPQWVGDLQRKLGVEPTAAQTHEFGYEPMSEIYRQCSAEFFGAVFPLYCAALLRAGSWLTSQTLEYAGTAVLVFCASSAHVSAQSSTAEISADNPEITLRGDAFVHISPSGTLCVGAAVAAVVTVLLFLFSRVSGGHFNCAVTLSFMLNKRMSVKRGCFYTLAQFLGSVCAYDSVVVLVAGAILKIVLPRPAEFCLGTPMLNPITTVWTAVALEFIFTMLLALVYLLRMHLPASAQHGGVMRRRRDFDTASLSRSRYIVKIDDDIGGYAGQMIAAVYLAAHCATLPFTGTALNPVRHIGPAIFAAISCNAFDHTWVFWVGPVGAGLCAALMHDVWFRPASTENEYSTQVSPSADVHVNADGTSGQEEFTDTAQGYNV